MLKALIIGADAVCPDYIFHSLELYPTLCKMVKQGASASYSAYVQKGYQDSYWSEMNWASIYTGLPPKEHKIAAKNISGVRNTPEMANFNGLLPFWEVLNANGISVGLWAADCCISPLEIDGYVISARYGMIETPDENRLAPREIQVCKKDQKLLQYIGKNPPARLYPRTLVQQGYTFEQLKEDSELAERAVGQYHFQDALENFEEELAYWKDAIIKTQQADPVEVLYFFTPTTDLIAHCCMCSDYNPVLIKAYQILDKFVGELIEALEPAGTMFLSDHGQQNFKDLIQCSDLSIQREAFSSRDEVLWLKNGYIAFQARNGALLFTAHALKGTFIACGNDICHTEVTKMRTLDIYPTLLEMLHLKIPDNRRGYVADIFSRQLVNEKKSLIRAAVTHQSVAFIQTHSVSITDIFINEIYIENRFADITVIGEEKYKEIFLNNPRVEHFIPFEKMSSIQFDIIYCGFFNSDTGFMHHIEVYRKDGSTPAW